MKEFLKEFETELIKLESSTRPKKEDNMFAGLQKTINNTLSLEKFEPKMKELCNNLLDKHDIVDVSDKLRSDPATARLICK
jgi:hypothetical protein